MFEGDSQSTLVCKVYLNEVEETDVCPISDGAADISCQEDETLDRYANVCKHLEDIYARKTSWAECVMTKPWIGMRMYVSTWRTSMPERRLGQCVMTKPWIGMRMYVSTWGTSMPERRLGQCVTELT